MDEVPVDVGVVFRGRNVVVYCPHSADDVAVDAAPDALSDRDDDDAATDRAAGVEAAAAELNTSAAAVSADPLDDVYDIPDSYYVHAAAAAAATTTNAVSVTAFVPNVDVLLTPSPDQKNETENWRNLSKTAFFSRPSIFSSESPTWDLSIYENRLKTFKNQWTLDFITSEQMANAGFYYLGVQDRVKCVSCSKIFECWLFGEDPYIEHQKKSPNCKFFEKTQEHGAIGIGSQPHTNNFNPDGEINRVQNFLLTMGVVKTNKVLMHNKLYSSFDTRLKSFEKCKKSLNQDVGTLCAAGFYYTGNGENDMMICYCCNQGLMDWEREDNPWEEHARWSSNCIFVRLSRDNQFVETVRGEVDNAANMYTVELCKLITVHQDMSIPTTNLTLRKLDTPYEVANKRQVADVSHRLSANTHELEDTGMIPESALCKICFKEKMEVLFIPCCHMFACIQCAVTFDDCAVCRQPYMMVIKMYICINERKPIDLKKKTGVLLAADESPDEPYLGSILCNVCHKEEMRIACIPCRHISCCLQCTLDKNKCPVCFEPYYGYIQVFI